MKFKIGLLLIFCFLPIKLLPIKSMPSESITDESNSIFRGIAMENMIPIFADISFCIADLKFDGKTLKICEFGEGCHSKFRGFDKLYGKGAAWALFWIYLSQFNLPIWYTGVSYNQQFKDEISYDTFTRCGGRFIDSVNSLQKDRFFLNLVGNGCIKNKYGISAYKAIVCVKNFNGDCNDIRAKYPNVLVWDIATAGYVNSKLKTTILFQDDELLKYRPMSWLIKRESDSYSYASYVKSVADQILKDKDINNYVIKPINGTMGQGVVFVQKNDLQKTLGIVLKKCKKNKIKENDLSYWASNKGNYCLIEEFVSSKTIVADDIPYDPTMRVVFALCYDNHVPRIDILGAYWKTPPLALDEPGKFGDKHKSHAAKQKHSALPVDPEDYKKVSEIMEQFMPKIYSKMLGI